MSHEIEKNNCMFVHQPAWHQLGVVLDHPPTSKEAIKAAGMDWTVEKRALYFQRAMPGGVDYEVVNGRVAVVRTMDQSLLSVVSDLYEPFQNQDAFAFFDPIVTQGLATYESAGVLKEGRRVWVLARLNKDLHVGNDDIRSYLLLCNSHDGTLRLVIQPTNVRVVCQNTLTMSLREGYIDSFRHTGGIMENMEARRDEIMAMIEGMENVEAMYQQFGKIQLGSDGVVGYVEEVLGFPVLAFLGNALDDVEERLEEDATDADEEHIETASAYKQKAKAEILRLHEEGQGAQPGTLWGIYNAVMEYVDHYANPNSKDRATYQLFGAGAELKQRALDVAKETAAANVMAGTDAPLAG